MKFTDALNTVVSVGVIIFAAVYFFRPEGVVHNSWTEWRRERLLKSQIKAEWKALSGEGARFGSTGADVVLIAFSDYQCPFCQEADRTLREALLDQPGTVVYRHFPITSIHPAAEGAARASICAERQGRFREMHRWLFETSEWHTEKNWVAGAVASNIADTTAFRTCLSSSGTSRRLAADVELARRLGIQGTPSFIHRKGMKVGAVSKEQMATLLAP